MPESRICSECGATLNSDTPDGFCPACLLQGALDLGATTLEFPVLSTKRFGDYELLEEIDRGGMGVVYRARQVSLDRLVALKLILLGPYAGTASVRRFRAEAAAAAKLQHPNIVAIHEIGEQDGQPFFSMDYVAGQDLEKHAREHPFTTRQAAQLLRTLAEAVQYAHEQGIVHRDLKPSNILIDADVEPHITDFGLAKRLADSQLYTAPSGAQPITQAAEGPQPTTLNPQLTLSGQVLGSPSFLPPEQASGRHGRVGPHTDVYALGAILYFLLTGRPPFAAETITDTLQEVLTEEPVAPRLINPRVHRDLETICLKCLEKEPARRYASARLLADELSRLLHGEPIQVRPISAPERAWRWCRRRPIVAGLGAAVLLSLGLGFIGVLWEWRQSEGHRTLAEQKADESRRNLYAADMLLAQGALEAENIGHAQEILRKYVPRKGEEDLRGWEWRYAWNQCQSDELFTLKGHGFAAESLAISRDGALLASGSSGEARVIVWDLPQKQRKRIIDFSVNVTAVLFAKDDQELIVGTARGQLSFFDTRTWQTSAVLTNDSHVRSLALSADGKTLAIYSMYSLRLLNLSDRREFARLELVFASEYLQGGLAFSPDSTSLAYCRGDGTIVLTNLIDAKPITQLKGHTNYVTSLAFCSNGKVLISGSRDRTVRVWDVESGRELRQLRNFAGFVSSIALSPNGRVLAVGGAGQRVKLFDTEPWDEINSFKGHTADIWATVFSPDGKSIFTASRDGCVKCWPVSKSRESSSHSLPADTRSAELLPGGKFLYLTHTNQHYSVWRTYPFEQAVHSAYPVPGFSASTVSPDGTLWIGAQTSGVVKVFRTAAGSLVQDLPVPGNLIRFAFSPDGRTLAGLQKDGTCHIWERTAVSARGETSEGSFRELSPLHFNPDQGFWSLAFAGSLLCVGCNAGLLQVRDIRSGTNVAELWGGDGGILLDVAISRDQSKIITASPLGKIAVWDLKHRCQTAALSGQLVNSFSVGFSPDESRIAACGGDGAVRVWDIKTTNQVATLKLHSERLSQLEFADAETLVALAGTSYGHFRLFVLRAPYAPDRPAADQMPTSSHTGDALPLRNGALRPDRLREAADKNLRLFGLPSRSTGTPSNLLNLSAFYNLTFEGMESWHFEASATQSPQKGRQKFGPVDHDVRGAIRLLSATTTYLEYVYPRRVDAIPVGQTCRRLFFLHFVFDPEREGTQVASYILKFADGKTFDIPVRYGYELRTWGPADQEFRLGDLNSSSAWSGTNVSSQPVRLYQTTWKNPRPNTRIESLDFVSSMSRSVPVLVAITTEP